MFSPIQEPALLNTCRTEYLKVLMSTICPTVSLHPLRMEKSSSQAVFSAWKLWLFIIQSTLVWAFAEQTIKWRLWRHLLILRLQHKAYYSAGPWASHHLWVGERCSSITPDHCDIRSVVCYAFYSLARPLALIRTRSARVHIFARRWQTDLIYTGTAEFPGKHALFRSQLLLKTDNLRETRTVCYRQDELSKSSRKKRSRIKGNSPRSQTIHIRVKVYRWDINLNTKWGAIETNFHCQATCHCRSK